MFYSHIYQQFNSLCEILDAGKKYFLSTKSDTWINAGSVCRKSGFKFLSLDSSTEQTQFINNLGMLDQKLLTPYVFVGATRRRKTNSLNNNEYEWVWSENGKVIDYSIDWAPGQPNNVGERCLGVSKNSGNWKMHDVPCENFRGKFFCQK